MVAALPRAVLILALSLGLASIGVACGGTASGPAEPELILATTTSTYDSGLLDVLVPDFEERTGYEVKTIAVGTGKALAMAERGEADVLLVHAPSAEKRLVEEGKLVDRSLVMHNFFVVAGPAKDPAGIHGTQRAVDAMERIAERQSAFVSRGDDSGTHKMEKRLWAQAGLSPTGSWYQETGQGMGATLMVASEKDAYTLTDIGTYLAFKNKVRLDVLVDEDPALLNVYSVLRVSEERFSSVNADGARAFAQYVVSPEAQAMIEQFGVDKFGRPLFIADAGRSEKALGR